MKKTNKDLIIAAAGFAAAVISGLLLFLILYRSGVFIPDWVCWSEKNAEDSICCSLKERRLTVTDREGSLIFESPSEYKVQDFILADIDDDGNTEIVVLLWKIGSYGQHLPFWVKQNDRNWGQHIFIYRYDGTFNSVWGTSFIPFEIDRWTYDPESLRIHIFEHGGSESDWMWSSWGLSEI